MTPIEHAKACEPAECAGFFVGETYHPCQNVAENPEQNFRIAPEALSLEATAIVHSHPDGYPWLSTTDRRQQHKSGLEWVLIVNGEMKRFRYAPLLRGRTFEYGIRDCYAVVRDAYMLCGIELSDYTRYGMKEDMESEMLTTYAPDEGFERVNKIQAGDMVISNVCGLANHAGFYLGEEKILHHPARQLSRVELLGNFWHSSIHSIWRHQHWRAEMIEAVMNDLEVSPWQ